MTGPTHPRLRMIRGTMQVLLAEGLLVPTSVLIAALLSRQLGAGGYGLFILSATTVLLLESIVVALFSRTTIRFVSEASDWKPVAASLMTLYLAAGIVATAALWLLAEPIAHLLGEPALARYLRLFSLEIPIFALAHGHRDVLIGLGAFRGRAITSAVRWVLRLALISLLIALGLSIEGAILGTIAASVVDLFFCRHFVRPGFAMRLGGLGGILSFAGPIFLYELGLIIFSRMDLFLLKGFGGTIGDAGIFGAAQNVGMVLGLFAVSFSPLLQSTIGRLRRGGDEEKARQIERTGLRVVFWLIPFVAMVAGSSSELVGLVFGEEFLPAAPVLVILVFGWLAMVMITILAAILVAGGKPWWTVALTVPLVPLAALCHPPSIAVWQAHGAATVTTACSVFGVLLGLIAARRAVGLTLPIRSLAVATLTGGLAYALASVWSAPGGWVVLKLMAISTIIVVVALGAGESERVRAFVRESGPVRIR